MPPKRGKGNARATSLRKAKDTTPDVYGDMLAEAAVVDPAKNGNRPLKRRRVMREVSIPEYHDDSKKSTTGHSTPKAKRPARPAAKAGPTQGARPLAEQTVEASSESDDSDDFAFEDVDLGQRASPE